MERFWNKVRKGPDCWEWQAADDGKGYGVFRLIGGRGGKNIKAHRLAWILVNGPIPNGAHLLHSCDNPSCVRPDHLRLGTHQDNMRDMVERRGVWNKGRHGTHCKNGHEYTRLNAAGSGRCMTCHNANARRLRAADPEKYRAAYRRWEARKKAGLLKTKSS